MSQMLAAACNGAITSSPDRIDQVEQWLAKGGW
jgi:hypothetical protein